ncbi:MAG: hypothetical protein IIY07_01605, partial [Thermoguttaceae bacterium]|nr:hypothetical protein [Thermoguttaceae bacterium]
VFSTAPPPIFRLFAPRQETQKTDVAKRRFRVRRQTPTWGMRRQFNGGNFRKISLERAAPTVKVDATILF